ncbi:hypothetical protein M569_09013, partial [Genlisea aurea]
SSSSVLQRRYTDHHGGDESSQAPDRPPRLLVLQPRIRPSNLLRTKLEEALNLANSLEQQRDGFYETDVENPPHLVVQNPLARSPRADTYFGAGTLETVKCLLNALESKGFVDAIFVNAALSGAQQRNLEASFHHSPILRGWGKPVLDRVGVIIEIFNAHAQTKEAKLQAELAALMYKRSRLVRLRGPDGRHTFGGSADAEVVSAKGRGSGGRGFISGAGETELQLQRRRISDRKKKLLSEIQEVRRTRTIQRAARKREGCSSGEEMATVAVVGYTNAGKSTLVSALSNSYLYCDNRLFATVDPKLSSVTLPSGRKVILSDTVGFISDLPVQLVEAFHATLEEVVEADLLVHVLDSSAQNLDEHRDTVMEVLAKIGVSDEKLRNMIEVHNKVPPFPKQCLLRPTLYESSLCCIVEQQIDLLEEQYHDVNEEDHGEEEDADEEHGIVAASGFEETTYYSDDFLESDDEQLVECCGDASSSSDPPESSSSGSLCHVRTSAVSGVGLKELLEVIDEKFGEKKEGSKAVERSIFYTKWRPPREGEEEV